MSIHEQIEAMMVTDKSFQSDVLNPNKLTLVDFWAPWCAPCKAVAPKLDAVLKELAGKFSLAKMNIEENNEIPKKYDVRSIPTLILFKDGDLVDRMVGNHSQEDIKSFVEKHIS